MDTRLTTAVPHMPLAPARLDTAPVRAAVRTDLPTPVAVAAQAGAEQSRWQRDRMRDERNGGTPKPTESLIETDRETGDLVYKTIDPETRETITQYPYESLLKLRAYVKSTSESQS